MPPTPPRPTSAQQQSVQWTQIDRALRPYSTKSLLVLLQASLNSPTCARFHDHLLMLWARVLGSPGHSGAPAGATDLPVLVETAVRAAPGRGVLTEREPNDPRAQVAVSTAAAAGLLLHPGELDHPLVFLRMLRLTAQAVDPGIETLFGFTLDDVLELGLRHSDHTVRALLPVWNAVSPGTDAEEVEISCGVTAQEVEATAALGADDLADIAAACTRPEHAARALDWLTADVHSLPLRYDPGAPLLGPVLALQAHGGRIAVPAGETLNALAAAAEHLTTTVDTQHGLAARLQVLTVARVAGLLGLEESPRNPPPVCHISSPSHRLDIAIVSALAGGELATKVEQARAALAEQTEPGRGRLVVYAGPRMLGREVVTDTLLIHAEELAEMQADAGGDRATVALFVLELTGHPEVAAVAYLDVLHAWAAWRAHGTLILPGPPRDDVVLVPAAHSDPSWDRAAAWAPIDHVLEDAGLPASLHWTTARLLDPSEAHAGIQADLHTFGSAPTAALVATVPPIAILTGPTPTGSSLFDLTTLTALADAVRTTITGSPDLATHFALLDSASWRIQLVPAADQPQPVGADRDLARQDNDQAVRLRGGTACDPPTISIEMDSAVISAFIGDGQLGHRALGSALFHLAVHVREQRGAGPGVDEDTFADAWDRAHPVLVVSAFEDSWPADRPVYAVPDSVHVQARALRTAAAAVRDARVPTGSWSGPEAIARGGPAEQLLHALETALAAELASYTSDLLPALASHLNAAWCTRTTGQQELVRNLAAPWSANWTAEAGRRQRDGATSTTALQLLLQQAIASPPGGTRSVDILAVADLVALAELVLHCGITAVASSRLLNTLHLEIHASGLFTLDVPDSEDTDDIAVLADRGFDQIAWQRALLEQWLANAREGTGEAAAEAPATAATSRTPTAFVPMRLKRGSQLRRADELLLDAWGCGFEDLRAVLSTASDWGTETDGLARVTIDALTSEAAVWSGRPEPQIRAAVHRLQLHPGNAGATRDHSYTEVERRIRLTTHPLITHDGTILIAPWVTFAAQQVYGVSLGDGRLPHPELPQRVLQALGIYRESAEAQLEKDIAAVAAEVGLPRFPNFDERAARKFGVPCESGEIDLLVADAPTQRLWVIEAKYPHPGHSPHALRAHLDRFTDPTKGHVSKLLRKAATVAAHKTEVARACGAPESVDWRVVPLMVTYSVEAAAFVAEPRVAYTVVELFADVITAAADPLPGWHPRRS